MTYVVTAMQTVRRSDSDTDSTDVAAEQQAESVNEVAEAPSVC